MIHGPCGNLNPTNVCMTKQGNCRSRYPQTVSSITTYGKNSYPKYKRRDDGEKIVVRGATLDNRWVVPYNSYLVAKFDCHINIEICSTIKAVQYNGHDRIAFNISVNNEHNQVHEIDNFQSARWISPPEAMWRIYGFILNEIHPTVYSLQLHLEDKQLVTFKKSDSLSNVLRSDLSSRTMLAKFFRLNKSNNQAQTLLYKNIPEYFVWDQTNKIWTARKRDNVIGRIVIAYPTEGERYYLRLLLNHIKGATSFDDLKFFNDVKVGSFRESTRLYGLLDSNNTLE
ncbi:hypothetical protein Ddye_004365 [Dipteronia dyeriana]|uniref:Uncharacterized protein n=1 Tax=Dipteronia dyeriana TaxID=168575 RepID=A0AAD9XU08_9ROSI|nr:hypothetical protein Ddye_004365 [Dipteronia dyeriana]